MNDDPMGLHDDYYTSPEQRLTDYITQFFANQKVKEIVSEAAETPIDKIRAINDATEWFVEKGYCNGR